jgi:hypothetical protein
VAHVTRTDRIYATACLSVGSRPHRGAKTVRPTGGDTAHGFTRGIF